MEGFKLSNEIIWREGTVLRVNYHYVVLATKEYLVPLFIGKSTLKAELELFEFGPKGKYVYGCA